MDEALMQRPLEDLPWAAIDFESAGAAPGETDCPVQVGVVRAEGLFDPAPHLFVSYIAPLHPVRWSAARVHGITTPMLAEAPSFASLWPQLRELLGGAAVLGHNPATEARFLHAFPGHGFGPWLDTLELARKALPRLRDHTLGSVCGALGCTPQVQALVPERSWHDALFDAAASLCLLRALVQGLGMQRAGLQHLPFAVRSAM